jgi:tRNA threonylcarbamoyladenosine biosynthesis protein TsaE
VDDSESTLAPDAGDSLSPAREGQIALPAATADDMKEWGRRLGRAMGVGDVVGLVGDLGAGKTTLAQGIAEGLEVPRDRHVASPTYALVNQHPGRAPFVHADMYRLRSERELVELGLNETFDQAAVVIEWIDMFPQALPDDHLQITIAMAPDGARTLSLGPTGPRGRRLAAALSER